MTGAGTTPQPGQTHPPGAVGPVPGAGRHSRPEPRREPYPETEPEITAGTEPGITAGTDPELDQAVDPGTDQAVDPGTDQAVDPGTDQAVDRAVGPELDPEIDLELDPEIDPEAIEPTTGAPLAMLPQRAPPVAVPVGGGIASDGPAAARAGAGSAPGSGATDSPADEEDFWLPIEEVHWDGTPITPTPRRWFGWFRRSPLDTGRRRGPRPPKPQRHPAVGLAGSVAFALAASFFAWVSAQPMWLAFGHGDRGVATVTGCTGSGLGRHCRGEFTATDGSYAAWGVRLVGVEAGPREPGSQVPARMVGPDSGTAYAGTGTGSLHLRWSLGLALVLLCGAGIGWASGALRLPGRWSRRGAGLVSLAGPLLIAAAFLLAAR